MRSLPVPGPDRPYVAAPFLGILATILVQFASGPVGLTSAQTVVVALITAGLLGAIFGTRYAGETAAAASLAASLATGGAVIVLIVAGSL
ncbi:hypothetical protein [Salinigranum salinum]|uniref:hypothetical protein n=1 Tax=Salinigranum salinum TaxID=1364937 RepID=UPI001260A46D|nr:hypothetical protein [Salinigranum salinum]